MTFPPSHPTSADWQALKTGLHRFVRSRVSAKEVEDVVSDILEIIIRNKTSLAAAQNPSAWIYAVARNKIVDFYRKRSRDYAMTTAFENDPTNPGQITNHGDDGPTEATGLADCLSGVIAGMAATDRTILAEIDLKQTRQTEFALRHDIALATVKSRIQRARKRLRDRLISCCPDGTSSGCRTTCQGNAVCAEK